MTTTACDACTLFLSYHMIVVIVAKSLLKDSSWMRVVDHNFPIVAVVAVVVFIISSIRQHHRLVVVLVVLVIVVIVCCHCCRCHDALHRRCLCGHRRHRTTIFLIWQEASSSSKKHMGCESFFHIYCSYENKNNMLVGSQKKK